MMRKASWLTALSLLTGVFAYGQMGTFMGKVVGEDGKGVPNIVIKIERKDIKGNWQTKTNKKGDWIYSGMPVPGQFAITCEMNGQVADALNGVRSQMGDPVELKDFCDLKKLVAKRKATEAAMATGQVTQEMARDMSPEQKAAMEKAMKERSASMAKNKALNDAYNAGMAAMQAKDFPTAIDSFKKAAELDPKQGAVWIQLAQAHDQSANAKTGAEKDAALQSAAENYQKSLELLPADAGLHNNFGLVLAKQKKFAEAQAELDKAAQLDPPGGGKYFFNLGAVMINTGQTDPAITAFKKAVELDPKYAPAWFQLGSALSGKLTMTPDGKPIAPEGMQAALEKYLELDPTGPNAEAAKSLITVATGTIETKYVNPDAKKAPAKKTTKK
jgi:tetratricopeptide (TPR) repeat protein